MATTDPFLRSFGAKGNTHKASYPTMKSAETGPSNRSFLTDPNSYSRRRIFGASTTLKDGLERLESSFSTFREESDLNAVLEEALGTVVNELKSLGNSDAVKHYNAPPLPGKSGSSTMISFMLKTIEKQQEQIEKIRVQLEKEQHWRTMAVSWMQRHLNALKFQPKFCPTSRIPPH